uniref:Cullin family profile domain-containing protein n=1 Tax=Panagrolaimus davidi TaxID=227884 RepID=A0A914P916_9BILA
MFGNLRQYDSIFKPKFIFATSKFYSIKAASKFEETDLPGYIAYSNTDDLKLFYDLLRDFEKDASSYFINTRPNKLAELIAKYMGTKMRAANKSYNDADFDKLMDRTILLFQFIQERGAGFTLKLEGMSRDMDISKDTLQALRTGTKELEASMFEAFVL